MSIDGPPIPLCTQYSQLLSLESPTTPSTTTLSDPLSDPLSDSLRFPIRFFSIMHP